MLDGGIETVAAPGASSWGSGVRTNKSGEEQQLGVVQCLYASGKSTSSPMNCISIC